MNYNATPNQGETLLTIVQQLAHETHPGHSYAVTQNTSFERELGLDSLAKVELLQRVGKQFAVELPPEALAEADTPFELLRFLGGQPQVGPQDFAQLPGASGIGTPVSAQTLLDILEWHVERQPDRMHILLHGEEGREHPISHLALHAAAQDIAAGLVEQGLRPRQTVALMLPTGRDYLASFFGVMMAGGIPVPIYPPARMAGIEDHLKRHAGILSNAEAALMITVDAGKTVAVMLQAGVPSLSAIVTPSDLRAKHGARAPDHHAQPSDIAFIQYTSGSTGAPKGVVLTHANLLANVRALVQASEATSEDRFVSWLPLYHDMGLIGAWFGSLYAGIPLMLMSPLAFLARPALWLETISRHRGTISPAPNFAYELCVRHVDDATLGQLDLSSWRLAFNGAEPVSPATLDAFAERFARCGLRREALAPVYGLAESSVGLALPRPGRGPRIDVILREPFIRERRAVPAKAAGEDTIALAGCGFPLPGHEIRIVDETGAELPERRVGRLEFRGPSTTSGYYRNPEATRALFKGDGWLDSGDDAYMFEGEVFLAGRVKDLIKRGGRNLYPYDLEDAIGRVPGIRQGCVAVFGSPDPATGSERLVVVAETRVTSPDEREQLRRAVNEKAVDVIGMPPDDIVLVPPHSVLKTSSGKIRRLASRQAYEQGTLAQGSARPWVQGMDLAARALLSRATVDLRRLAAWGYGVWTWTVLAVLALPFGAPVLIKRPAFGRRVARVGARLLFRLVGMTPTAIGLERLPRQPHVLLVNHASYLDGIVLTALLPPAPGYAFAAKREFTAQPLIGRFLAGLGAFFLERADARRSDENIGLMVAALRRGENVTVFPEGTFTREEGIRPFHVGAFIAAAQAGAPIVVAGLRGTRMALRDGSWRPRRTLITFEIGPALVAPGPEWSATVRLRDEARDAMAKLSGEFAL